MELFKFYKIQRRVHRGFNLNPMCLVVDNVLELSTKSGRCIFIFWNLKQILFGITEEGGEKDKKESNDKQENVGFSKAVRAQIHNPARK